MVKKMYKCTKQYIDFCKNCSFVNNFLSLKKLVIKRTTLRIMVKKMYKLINQGKKRNLLKNYFCVLRSIFLVRFFSGFSKT